MITDVFTQTLTSGQVYTIEAQVTFGQAMITAAMLLLMALIGLDFLLTIFYRRRNVKRNR